MSYQPYSSKYDQHSMAVSQEVPDIYNHISSSNIQDTTYKTTYTPSPSYISPSVLTNTHYNHTTTKKQPVIGRYDVLYTDTKQTPNTNDTYQLDSYDKNYDSFTGRGTGYNGGEYGSRVNSIYTSSYDIGRPSNNGFSDATSKHGLSFFKEMLDKLKREDLEEEKRKKQLEEELERKRESQKVYNEKEKVDYLSLLKTGIADRRAKSSSFNISRSSTMNDLPSTAFNYNGLYKSYL